MPTSSMEDPDRHFASLIPLLRQQSSILRHLLFWLQDQPYYRNLWHGAVSHLPLSCPSLTNEIDDLLLEIELVRRQYPYGYSPAQEADACTLRDRLSLLMSELRALRAIGEACQAV